MNCLAIECCLDATSVALARGAGRTAMVYDDYLEHPAGQHDGRAEMLLPMLSALVARAGGFAGIERIAVTRGPGSFTGVRVGLAAARGLALALERPVVGISALAVIAHRADTLLYSQRLGVSRDRAVMIVAVDARRNALYAQIFDASVAEPLTEPELLSPQDVLARLARVAPGRRALVVGSGGALVMAVAGPGADIQQCLPNLQPHARQLAMLAPALSASEGVEPIYLRAPDVRPQDGQALPRIATS